MADEQKAYAQQVRFEFIRQTDGDETMKFQKVVPSPLAILLSRDRPIAIVLSTDEHLSISSSRKDYSSTRIDSIVGTIAI